MKSLRRHLPEIDLGKPIPAEILERMRVTAQDFADALREIEPSAMREVFVEVPTVTWADVGGLEEVKKELYEAVEMPMEDPEPYIRMGIRPPRGVLLFGAPGTGRPDRPDRYAGRRRRYAGQHDFPAGLVMSPWVR